MSASLDRFASECADYITKNSSKEAVAAIDKHINASVPHPSQNAEVRQKIDAIVGKKTGLAPKKTKATKVTSPRKATKRKADAPPAAAAAAPPAASPAKRSRKSEMADFVEYDSDDEDWEEDESDEEEDDDDGDVEMEGDDLFDIAKFRKGRTLDVDAADAAFHEWKRGRAKKKPAFDVGAYSAPPEIDESAFIRSRIKLTEGLIKTQKERLADVMADMASGELNKREMKECVALQKSIANNIANRVQEVEQLKSEL